MSAAISVKTRVERYLRERRRLGFLMRSTDGALRSFARHVQTAGHQGPLTVEIMADWARRKIPIASPGRPTSSRLTPQLAL